MSTCYQRFVHMMLSASKSVAGQQPGTRHLVIEGQTGPIKCIPVKHTPSCHVLKYLETVCNGVKTAGRQMETAVYVTLLVGHLILEWWLAYYFPQSVWVD